MSALQGYENGPAGLEPPPPWLETGENYCENNQKPANSDPSLEPIYTKEQASCRNKGKHKSSIILFLIVLTI